MRSSRASGTRWERVAESFLHARGLKTVTRNFHCRLGEIDLIMQHGDCLVFAEVRYRRTTHFGSGAESVTRAKQNRIIRAAKRYLQHSNHHALQACRFDVLSLNHDGGRLNVTWIQDAFSDI
jgi:putative endonuclease